MHNDEGAVAKLSSRLHSELHTHHLQSMYVHSISIDVIRRLLGCEPAGLPPAVQPTTLRARAEGGAAMARLGQYIIVHT